MKYLFFDIECATSKGGGKLCEFGYVLTTDKFSIIKRENIIINPDCEFDSYVIRSLLNFKESEYKAKKKFDFYHEKIISLLTDNDTLVIGHTTQGDAEHIGDDCIRYGFKAPEFDYVDIVELYKIFSDLTTATGLTNMCKELGIAEQENAHSADVDAFMTMQVVIALTKKYHKDLFALISDKPEAKGKLENYEEVLRRRKSVDNYVKYCAENGIKLTDKDEESKIRLFIKNAVKTTSKRNDKIYKKEISISGLLFLCDFNKSINLIQEIVNRGGRVTFNCKKSDIFVKYDVVGGDNLPVYCKKLDMVKKAIEKGESIEIIDFKDFIGILGIKEESLDKRIDIDFEKLERENSREVIVENETLTIGDLLSVKTKRT